NAAFVAVDALQAGVEQFERGGLAGLQGVGRGVYGRQHCPWSVVRGPLSLAGCLSTMYTGRRRTGRCHGQRTTDNGPMTNIAILGGSGYTAVELIKILLRHPHARIVAVTSRQEGTPHIADVHPSLT